MKFVKYLILFSSIVGFTVAAPPHGRSREKGKVDEPAEEPAPCKETKKEARKGGMLGGLTGGALPALPALSGVGMLSGATDKVDETAPLDTPSAPLGVVSKLAAPALGPVSSAVPVGAATGESDSPLDTVSGAPGLLSGLAAPVAGAVPGLPGIGQEADLEPSATEQKEIIEIPSVLSVTTGSEEPAPAPEEPAPAPAEKAAPQKMSAEPAKEAPKKKAKAPEPAPKKKSKAPEPCPKEEAPEVEEQIVPQVLAVELPASTVGEAPIQSAPLLPETLSALTGSATAEEKKECKEEKKMGKEEEKECKEKSKEAPAAGVLGGLGAKLLSTVGLAPAPEPAPEK